MSPENRFPEAIVHDRDGIYGHWLPDILEEFDCLSVKTPPRSPWLNPFIERCHGSLKTEMLNRLVLIDNNHIRDLCLTYRNFYNKERPHQGIWQTVSSYLFELIGCFVRPANSALSESHRRCSHTVDFTSEPPEIYVWKSS